jgi:hypothetical protein
MTSKTASEEARTSFFAQTGPMPRIISEPRYFSMPSVVVGGMALRNEALNWTPCLSHAEREAIDRARARLAVKRLHNGR